MNPSIGIDALAFSVPEGFLELTDLAGARGVPPGKYVEGLGVTRMAVAQPWEDTVTLAAAAGKRLLAQPGVDRDRIGLCIVGTETAVDHSKPVASYVHSLLGLPERSRIYETKHACYGGTAGVLTAADWIVSGAARGRTALILCSDIARYGVGSPGEPTQGAGAVALLISAAPRLVALEHGLSGSFSRDVHDFWRPLYTKEALVDGHHSVQCYLDALSGAYAAFADYAADAGGDLPALARYCYHVPYGKMARKAHRQLCAGLGRTEAEADQSFAREVQSSLRFPAEVGNVYTGSLWLALASLLHAEAEELEGQRLGLFSYGSGCTAEFFSARVVGGAGAHARALDLSAPLADRRRYSVAEYEAIRAGDDDTDRRGYAPEFARAGAIRFLGVDGGRRIYG